MFSTLFYNLCLSLSGIHFLLITCCIFYSDTNAVQSSWGLTVKDAVGTPCTEFYNFTVPESEAMIRGVKRRLGQQYTITHLGHAATVLALLNAKPLPPNTPCSQALITPLPVDGRRFL